MKGIRKISKLVLTKGDILVWPVVIYVSWKFVTLNLKHISKMEYLEEFENTHS